MLRQEEQPDGEPRFTMLETIRAYALERLEASGEADEIRRRHAQHFVAVDERIEADWREGDVDWLALERDHDNFRAALARARRPRATGSRSSASSRAWTVLDHARSSPRRLPLVRRGGAARRRPAAPAPGASLGVRGDVRVATARSRARPEARRAGARSVPRAADDTDGEAWALRQLAIVAELRGDLDRPTRCTSRPRRCSASSASRRALLMVITTEGSARLNAATTRAPGHCSKRASHEPERSAPSKRLSNISLDLGVLALHERRYEDSVPLFAESPRSALGHGWRVDVALLAARPRRRGGGRGDARVRPPACSVRGRSSEEIGELA